MSGKGLALPAHKKLVASLEEMAPHLHTIVTKAKEIKVPPGVKATMQSFPKLVAWLQQNGDRYEALVESMKPKAAPKTQRAAG